jgi:hypothetical protein
MSKTIEISDEAAAIFQKEVDRGSFPDVRSAIEDAARQLVALDFDAEFEAGLAESIRQAERGESVELTRELTDQIFEEALAEHRARRAQN